jgi:hypothetical protein
MKQKLNVTTILDQPRILERLVEKLAVRHTPSGNHKIKLPRGLKEMETSSTETYVSGIVRFEEYGINMPFVTSHIFTCFKLNDDSYSIGWSTSLS